MYVVSTKANKKVEEKIFFSEESDGREIILIIGYRTGSVWCEDKPDMSEHNTETGSEMGSFTGYSDEEIEDGCFFRIESESKISEQEATKIEEAWFADLEEGMSELGWTWNDRELWFYGELEIEEK